MPTISDEPLITEQPHPYREGITVAISQTLEFNKDKSLCRQCKHRANQYKDCEIASVLYELALSSGITTLVKWCPTDLFEFRSYPS